MEHSLVDASDPKLAEDYLESCIAKQEPLQRVLRLACLLSLTKGIDRRRFDYLKREMVQTYGFEKMLTLNNLETLGMFQPVGARRPQWLNIRRTLKLVEDREKVQSELKDPKAPTDFHFVYSGYAPLSIRLIEYAHRPGWQRLHDVMNLIPGKMFEYSQELPASVQELAKATHLANTGTAAGTKAPTAGTTPGVTTGGTGQPTPSTQPATGATTTATATGNERKKPLTLVFFLGGVTFAEISALRFLAERDSHGRDYLIATTKLINGTSLLESVQETVVNRLRRATIKVGGTGNPKLDV